MLFVWKSKALEKGLPSEEVKVEHIKRHVNPTSHCEHVSCNVVKCVGDVEVGTTIALVA